MTKTVKCKIGWIGFGNFGKLAVPYLSPVAEVMVYDRNPRKRRKLPKEATWGTLEQVASCDIVVLAITQYPHKNFIALLKSIASLLKPGAIVIDVCSNKRQPVDLIEQYLPDTQITIIPMHPLFGQMSAAKGIEGKKIVLCPGEGVNRYVLNTVVKFLEEELELEVILTDPDSHDREMAPVQGRTHFICRGIKDSGFKPKNRSKPADYVNEAVHIICSDSQNLFLTTQLGNPYALSESQNVIIESKRLLDRILADMVGGTERKVDEDKAFCYFIGWVEHECGITASPYPTASFDRMLALTNLATRVGWEGFVRKYINQEVIERIKRFISATERKYEWILKKWKAEGKYKVRRAVSLAKEVTIVADSAEEGTRKRITG